VALAGALQFDRLGSLSRGRPFYYNAAGLFAAIRVLPLSERVKRQITSPLGA
jgi:hypothetical protein